MIEITRIGIIGSGNMGLSIATRLFLSGYNVIIGSRTPDTKPIGNYEVTSIDDCIRRTAIIFVAIHPEYYTDGLIRYHEQNPSLFDEKILVDLSNQSGKQKKQDIFSNAERLQMSIPNAHVVKGFNTVSSFLMQSMTAGEPHNIFVASDHSHAKDKVIALAREMNFESFNVGSLRAARRLEKDTKNLFSQWHIPLVFSMFVIVAWLTYILCMYYIEYSGTSWNQLFLSMPNKALGPAAITLLALVYMPSNIACIFQLCYGTREKRFPDWLDRWMLSRKQLGLITFAIGLLHTIFTIILLSPSYMESWFQAPAVTIATTDNRFLKIFHTSLMSASGEIAALLGVLTLLSMSILAITSIPAVGNLLNWREWRFIQSKIGTITLLLCIGHVIAVGMPFWLVGTFGKALYSLAALCLYIPVLTIILKFIFLLPCLSRMLYRIRRGESSREKYNKKSNI